MRRLTFTIALLLVLAAPAAAQFSTGHEGTPPSPVNVVFSAGNFTSDVGSWTVALADQIAFWYVDYGNGTALISFRIGNSTVATTPAELRITFPNGWSIAPGQSVDGPYYLIDNATASIGHYTAFAGNTFLTLRTQTNADFVDGTDNNTVTGQVLISY